MYRIKDWDDTFENNRTREMKTMRWVPISNRFDGDGYTTIMEEPDGAAIYGAWIACVNLASRCDPRGTLLRSPFEPHTVASIARITRIKPAILERMIEVCRDKCKWLIPLDMNDPAGISHLPAEIPHRPALEGMEGIEENRKENSVNFWANKSKKKKSAFRYTDDFQKFWKAYPATRRKNKGTAFLKWRSARAGGAAAEDIIAGAERYSQEVAENGTAAKYIKYPEGWITARKWEDETTETKQQENERLAREMEAERKMREAEKNGQ